MGEFGLVSVLFVCLGNICRSPTAEGVFRHLVEREGLADAVRVDSAGTGAWHIGSPPDSRAQVAARRRGIDLSRQRARQTRTSDFETFDYILAMDRANFATLAADCPGNARQRIHMFLDFAPGLDAREVPDPYYGGPDGFDIVLDMVEAASKGLLDDIRRRHL